MSDEWWNLDQSIAWVMTRDENIVAKLKDGSPNSLTALILYPIDLPFCFQRTKGDSEEARISNNEKRIDFWKKFGRGTEKDFLAALKKGRIMAYGFENGMGSHVTKIEPDWWEDLEISSLTRPSNAVNKAGNGEFWSRVRVEKREVVKVFKAHPRHNNFSASASAESHEKAYRKYNAEKNALYINGTIKKPWDSQIKEDADLSQKMGSGFNRKKFREARKKVLAQYPHAHKTNLSQNDHNELKAFISKPS